MTAKTLTSRYAQLRPNERYPLILSALLRGDEAEADRLRDSAPLVHVRVGDYHGLLEGFHLCFLIHVIECLDLIAWIMRCDLNTVSLVLADEPAEWYSPAQRLLSLLLRNRCEAWRQFCTEKGIDGDAYLRLIPPAKSIEQAEAAAKSTAFTVEQANAWLQEQRDESAKEKGIDTFLDELAAIHALFAGRWA